MSRIRSEKIKEQRKKTGAFIIFVIFLCTRKKFEIWSIKIRVSKHWKHKQACSMEIFHFYPKTWKERKPWIDRKGWREDEKKKQFGKQRFSKWQQRQELIHWFDSYEKSPSIQKLTSRIYFFYSNAASWCDLHLLQRRNLCCRHGRARTTATASIIIEWYWWAICSG